MKEFKSFGQFGAHLAKLAVIGEEVTHHIVGESAKLVQHDAKRRIGEYQDYTGPFSSWAELADSTKADRARKGFSENDPLLRTGTLRDSIEITQQGNEVAIGSADKIALYQELGTDPAHNDHPIPPRPFLGPALFSMKNGICTLTLLTVVEWLTGRSWRAIQSRLP